jgi:uncharacterized lipoprotein YbaY
MKPRRRFARSLLLFAPLPLLAACAAPTPDRAPPTAASGTVQGIPYAAPALGAPASAYRPGAGVVESASVVSLATSPSDAAAGGTTQENGGATMGYRVKMDDGSMQSILQKGERFAVGERVEVTADGRLSAADRP